MPVYQYKCTVCQERFEVEQSFSDDPLTTLPGCENDEHRLKKVFSPVGIAFKGGGFYRNEARTSSTTSTTSTSSESSTSSSESSKPKTDTAPAAASSSAD
jgi:putative FmdB family regulatory protein